MKWETGMTGNHRPKLIEVALPLDAINKEALNRKMKAPKGWPTSFHKWWAQRPLAAARAVLFAQLVDDPSASPDRFKTEEEQERERLRLFGIIEDLVAWDNTNNERVLAAARDAILESWRRACTDFAQLPDSHTLFDPEKLPPFCDPFAGSGSLPLSAQWLGLESLATDLNPVAVVINKATVEIPSLFAAKPPVNPAVRGESNLFARNWRGAKGLADDVRHYGQWMHDEAAKRFGHLHPKLEITAEMAKRRPDLKPLVHRCLTVTAWLWARTVRSPNPAFNEVHIPLASTFVISTKTGRETYVEPIIEGGTYTFSVKVGKPSDPESTRNGTKLSRGANFQCLMSRTPIASQYIYDEANAGRMGARLMAIVADSGQGRVYLSPTPELEALALRAEPKWKPDLAMPDNPRWFSPPLYGLKTFGDLFTNRQLVALTTVAELVGEVHSRIEQDAIAASLANDGVGLAAGGSGATAYADAVCTYLACVLDRMAYYGSSLSSWLPKDSALRDCMPRQALAMTWDFAECNPLGKSSGDITTCVNVVSNYLDVATPSAPAVAQQADAQYLSTGRSFIFSTDPPYYDNIGYADLSDYFYVWLRRALKPVFPDLFATLAVPRNQELVATPYRHGSKEKAEQFFLEGMTRVMEGLAANALPGFPVTIYYAFKQSETDDEDGITNTGWDTFLDAVIRAGFAITGTWPMRTERAGRMIASGTNALASSIVLVCRPKPANAMVATRREFLASLRTELPKALKHLQRGNIAPVDLAQAAIGPGMAVYTRFAKVLDAEGKPVAVREALSLINQSLDEALAEQEGDFDGDSRWAVAWFEQFGFSEGEYGAAETLSKAKNTSVAGMVEAGILKSKSGKVRLLRPDELPASWDPETDARLTAWESVHHLVRVLELGGESAAADLAVRLGPEAEIARELAYRLYTVCERKKRAQEALSYNALVQSWPEITRLAREGEVRPASQTQLFDQE